MSTTWFTSDLHLGHRLMVEHRAFASIEQHDLAIFDNWVRVIRDDDIVWILGDISIEGTYKHALEVLAQLPGRKRLVTGNHDRAWVGKSDAMRFMPEYLEVFEVVTPWARAKLGQTKVVLSHFPYVGDHTGTDRFPEYRLPFSETPILHGHTHSDRQHTLAWDPHYRDPEYPHATTDWQKRARQLHVGVDAWGLAPVASYTLEKLLL